MNLKNRLETDESVDTTSLSKTKTNDRSAISNRVTLIPLSVIESNPMAARKRYDEVGIVSLADSIRRHGLLQPILVKKINQSFFDKPRYLCVAGERRLRAFQMLSRDVIPCFVIKSDQFYLNELSLVENLLRADLDMFECAASFLYTCVAEAVTANELASRLSASQTDVMNKIALSQLSSDEQLFMLKNRFTEGHAHALLRIEDDVLRQKMAALVAERDYDEKSTARYIDAILREPTEFVDADAKDDRLASFLHTLNRSLTLLRDDGVPAQVEEFEHEDEVQYLIRIPKK